MPLSLVGRSFSNNLCHRACLELVQRLTLWGHSRFGGIRLDLDRLNQARVAILQSRLLHRCHSSINSQAGRVLSKF